MPPAGQVCRVLMTLPGVPESVALFRQLVRDHALTAWQGHTAAACVSELATNAITHTPSGLPGGMVTVLIEPGPQPGEMRVTVRDDGPAAGWEIPAPPPDVIPEHGYGLAIVDTLAADWGTDPAAHATWCEIPDSPAAPAAAPAGSAARVAVAAL